MTTLSEHRIARGVTLGTIESSTRIGRHFLEAIEAEEFNRLPGGVYTTSYLRQYARAIGFDETDLLRRYREKVQPSSAVDVESAEGGLSRRLLDSFRAMVEHIAGRHQNGTQACSPES